MTRALTFHPRPDEHGQPVPLRRPSTPTPLSHWLDPIAVATVIPDGPLPPRLNGVALAPAALLPLDVGGWEALAGAGPAFEEPPYPAMTTLKAAAGVAIEEEDGRVWLVSPSNAFGGYASTLPKGRADPGLSLRATALKEAWEEAGLLVRLTGFLLDSARTNTLTRYYRARRVGGHPGAMCWETQAVHLVPRARLVDFLTHPNDVPLLRALAEA
ncbi:NUDIX hydrolase [Azohydromonas caseinilytica]|uniref:NUDIX hydrolase n=1 Tax=Azohydromonas caseinilytica TaxID=2728836 RepID=A0A848FLH6_9BURK|nr:NUDIX hydrolase [Azohydromonas caseinilytica]NML18651.1 NUDIX hydrolase [Azohydromonas caseinilytica]